MCMITYVPAGVELPEQGIRNGADTNDDGHGWACANATEIRTGRSMNFDSAWADLVATRDAMGGGAVVFHSRWATHGEYGLYNVHPFTVTADSVMAHNGILPGKYLPSKGERRSDTRLFVDRVAKDVVGNNGVPSRRVARRLAEEIGYGNKLAFLGVGPVVRIINAWAGEWSGGVWYSNGGYKRARFNYRAWRESAGSAVGAWQVESKPREVSPNGYPCAIEPARTFEPVTRPGVVMRAGVATCGGCGGLGLDFRNGVCRDCWYCLDCNSKLVDCDCFMSGQSRSVAEYVPPAITYGMWD